MSNFAESPIDPARRSWLALIIVQLIAITLLACFCTSSERYLFADGAGFFLGILKNQKVSDFFPERYYAHVAMQLPAVVSLKVFGVKDVNAAGMVYGATLFLIPVFGMFTVWWAARRAPVRYLAFPLLTQSILLLDGSMLSFVETYPATWVFWSLLYLLIFSERLTVLRSITLLTLAVASMRMYESYMFLAWPIVFVAVRRAFQCRRPSEVIICVICTTLVIASAAIAVYSTLFPFDANNRQNFAKSILDHFEYGPVRFSILVLAGVLWQVLLPRRALGDFFWFFVVTYGAVTAAAPLYGYQQAWSYQYLARVQALYIPMLFGCLVAWNPTALREFANSSGHRQVAVWRLLALTCVVAVIFQTSATVRWNDYRRSVVSELAKQRGEIYVETSQRIREFDWGWAMPALSVTLSALDLHSIPTAIPNPDPNSWQVFNPRDPADYPNLGTYGIPNEFVSVPKVEIVKAEYGSTEIRKDVTETLQKRLNDSRRISLPSATYNESFGGDPIPNKPKRLIIQYRLNEIDGEVSLAENSPIVLPFPAKR